MEGLVNNYDYACECDSFDCHLTLSDEAYEAGRIARENRDQFILHPRCERINTVKFNVVSAVTDLYVLVEKNEI